MVATAQRKYPCPSPATELLEEKYKSDEFRLYCFKVLPCSQRKHHDWTKCPFAHVGERAKRRSLRTHVYDCEMCPAIAKGEECSLGASCSHSHNAFESWLHPQKYRTLLCKDGHKCDKYVCFFAHGVEQLRAPSNPHVAQPLISQLSAASDSTFTGELSSHPSLGKLGAPTSNTPTNECCTPADLTALSLLPGNNANFQTVALLMEQVHQARKMAQESREAAAQAEMQLKVVTDAMFSQANFGSSRGMDSGPNLPPMMPAVSSVDPMLMTQTPAVGPAVPSTFPANPSDCYLQVVTPSSVALGGVPCHVSWPGTEGAQLGGAASGVMGGMLQGTSLSSIVASNDMAAAMFGSSPGSTVSLAGVCDLAYPGLGAPGMQTNQRSAVSMFMRPEQQQPPMLLNPAVSARVLCQAADGELLQGSPCSSSTAYYF